ncbi:hypothetical protein ABTM57_20880, partial [Acinetobacter baumannii]
KPNPDKLEAEKLAMEVYDKRIADFEQRELASSSELTELASFGILGQELSGKTGGDRLPIQTKQTLKDLWLGRHSGAQ